MLTSGSAAGAVESADVDAWFAQHRAALTGHCYRMLGSASDAEDAVQETFVRAWRSRDGFEGRAAPGTWLHRIATNVCLDALQARGRRALPLDLSGEPFLPVVASLGDRRPGEAWLGPVLDRQVVPAAADPAEVAVAREAVRLAFVAALQHLPPRQRAALLLRDVLRWSAAEVADLLGTSTAAVNSALQRARVTLADVQLASAAADGPLVDPLDEPHRSLLARYVESFERYDVAALVALLHEDATQSMPPFAMWLRGAADIGAWALGPGEGCRGSRLAVVAANGTAAVTQWRPEPDGGYAPWALHVLGLREGRVGSITSFLDLGTGLFASLGLPQQPPRR